MSGQACRQGRRVGHQHSPPAGSRIPKRASGHSLQPHALLPDLMVNIKGKAKWLPGGSQGCPTSPLPTPPPSVLPPLPPPGPGRAWPLPWAPSGLVPWPQSSCQPRAQPGPRPCARGWGAAAAPWAEAAPAWPLPQALPSPPGPAAGQGCPPGAGVPPGAPGRATRSRGTAPPHSPWRG